jgi:predicted extracellular nuclease
MAVYTPDAEVDPQVGEVYTLSGSAEEFYDFTQLRVVDTNTDMTLTGTGTPMSESLSEAPADWEPYEGALLTLADVTVMSEEDEFGEVSTNYNIGIDNLYYEHESANGDTFATVTGVVYYSFSEWKIEPRDAADLVP